MSMKKYKLNCKPVCRPQAVIQGDGYRISVLTEALLRLEYILDRTRHDMVNARHTVS